MAAINDKYLSPHELALRISLAKEEAELESVISWLTAYRGLNPADRRIINTAVDKNHIFAARMTLLLFGVTPSFSFGNGLLVVNDIERVKLILNRAAPYIKTKVYETKDGWLDYFTRFDINIWPILSPSSEKGKKNYRAYERREESPLHRRIKQELIANVENYFGAGWRLWDEEFVYETNDRANLIAVDDSKTTYAAIEVETIVKEGDIVGLLQAVKYKYMLAVKLQIEFSAIRGVLAARKISPSVKNLANRYGIETLEICS